MIWLDENMLEERKKLKQQLKDMDQKIAESFWADYVKMSEAGDDFGIMEIAGQLPLDFTHIHKLYQACIEIQDARKKLTSPSHLIGSGHEQAFSL
jgi:hypothetical protein